MVQLNKQNDTSTAEMLRTYDLSQLACSSITDAIPTIYELPISFRLPVP